MKAEALARAKVPRKVVFHRVAENLYRLEQSGGYYGLVKRGGKQFRKSLKTNDRKLAERRLTDLRVQVGRLSKTEDSRLSFEDVADRWMQATAHTVKESTMVRRRTCIANFHPFFAGVPIRNILTRHCERWLTERASKIAPQTMANELNVLRPIFRYAVENGLMLINPAADIRRRRAVAKQIIVPTREQFHRLIRCIRESDGRPDSMIKAKAGADLVELLAYSGCRIAEASALKWSDANLEESVLTITGGEFGTKNYETRMVPMSEALKAHLLKLRMGRDIQTSDPITPTAKAKTCLATACRKLGYPRFTHHDFRHFFATTCIESGVDIPTVSRWLGHSDGGALAMRVYGHLRQEHSFGMAKRVEF